MKVRTSIVAAGAAVVLTGTGALALPAAASTHSPAHTLTFISEKVNSVGFSPTSQVLQDTDVNSAGRTIGFDDLYLTFSGPDGAARVALALQGGFLYGRIATANGGRTFSGEVTGGTGAFTGATGTITAKAVTSQKTAVTITYIT